MALRGHAAIQGSSDIPTLYNLLPGYMPVANAEGYQDLAAYQEKQTKKGRFWGHMDGVLISLLKAWSCEAATAANDYCSSWGRPDHGATPGSSRPAIPGTSWSRSGPGWPSGSTSSSSSKAASRRLGTLQKVRETRLMKGDLRLQR